MEINETNLREKSCDELIQIIYDLERQVSDLKLRLAIQDDSDYYTLEQLQSMSSSFIEKHWDKVSRSLKKLSEEDRHKLI